MRIKPGTDALTWLTTEERAEKRSALHALLDGRRFFQSEKAELRRWVLELCALDFADCWRHVHPFEARDFFLQFSAEFECSRYASEALARLRDALLECDAALASQTGRDIPLGDHARMLRDVRPQTQDLINALVTNRDAETWLPLLSSSAGVPAIPLDPTSLLRVPHFLPRARLTRRQAVAFVFQLQCSYSDEPKPRLPDPRDFATASLLTGEAIPDPGAGGLTVFQVINRETKAMRLALEAFDLQTEDVAVLTRRLLEGVRGWRG